MFKRIISSVMISVMILLSFTTAYATPPAHPHIESGTAAEGGNYFQYLSSSGWKDLKTPPHWVVETGEVAYCVDHKADSPNGNETYSAFNPQALYSSRTYYGLLAILKAGYPYKTGGLSATQARYATANAIRAWLSESAGIGYNFMNLSRGYVRPKSGQQATYDFMVSLVNKARNNEQPVFSISTNPSNVKLSYQGNQLTGQFKIVFSNINGYYSIDESKLPSGVTISGYTGSNGDVLTISAPISYAGQTITLSNIFEAHDTRATSNMYWFEPNGDEQPVLVPVTDTTKPVVSGSMTFNSDALGYIEIIKTDADSEARLSGAVYKILNSSGDEVARLTTDAQGYAKSDGLATGTYKLQEVTAPSGYLLDTTVYGNISVTSNNTTTVNLTNEQPKGVIRITKTNGNTGIGDYSLEGAQFSISDANGTVTETVTTDAQGNANSSELPLGVYIVKEICAPYGFTLNNTEFTASLTYESSTVSIVYDDIAVEEQPQSGKIRIAKGNANPEMGDYPLGGAVFEIQDDNGNTVAEITTDSNGYGETGYLPLGEYTVRETIAPYGYILNDEVFTATLSYAGQTVSVVYDDIQVNEMPQTGTITIMKRDSETDDIPQGDASLNGAIFEIYDSGGNLVDQLDCGDTLKATSQALPLGTYTIKEIQAPEGYLLNDTAYTVEIAYSNQNVDVNHLSYIISDDVIKGQIAITKFADVALAQWETENPKPPLENVEFEIRMKSTGELVDTLVTDSDGKAKSIMLPFGTYTVTETKTTQGYMGCDPFDVTIDENGEVYSYIVENEVYKSKVKIIKVDSETGEAVPFAGTEFQIKDSNGDLVVQTVTYPQEKQIDTFVTDETGTLTLPEPLIYGDYTLYEVKAPYGYWLNETPTAFSIDDSGEDLVTIEFSDELIQKRIRVIKTDSRDNERRLAGAVFEVYKGETLVDTITTNENGYAETKLLTVGEYTFVEVEAPTGFVLDDVSFEVTIDNEDTMVYTCECENNPTMVTITKTDISDGKLLPDAHIEIYNENEELVYEGDTDENGELAIFELPIGRYTYKETAAPIGYVLNETVFEFEILENGEIIGSTNIEDVPTEVTLSKIDLVDGRLVANAVIEILNSDREIVFTGKTDENGEITVTHLPAGTYTFKETKAPDGYILSIEEVEFSIDEYGEITGETMMTNSPTALEINKVIYETNEPLTGAGFSVKNFLGLNTLHFTENEDGSYRLDKDGNVTEIMVDENGQAIIYGLPLGNYWLEEATVPSGYYPTAPVKVTIGETNNIEVPYKAVIPNSVFVKLGLDRDKYNVPIAIGVTILIIGIVAFMVFKRRKKRRNI